MTRAPAPPGGDASLEGNVFGLLAMLLLVAYVAATKHFRQDMDVTTFMATICPIAGTVSAKGESWSIAWPTMAEPTPPPVKT